MEKSKPPHCARCTVEQCNYNHKGIPPTFCPENNLKDAKVKTIRQNLDEPDTVKISLACQKLMDMERKRGYLSRVEEVIQFAKIMGYKKIGIAFCIGLHEEARRLDRILVENGFDVVSVACSAGIPDMEDMKTAGFEDAEFMHDIVESNPQFKDLLMCNPLMQAEVLNRYKTELNIMLGLCIGHDILFIRKSKADVTPLVVKDRVTGHNPIQSLYLCYSYYRKKYSQAAVNIQNKLN